MSIRTLTETQVALDLSKALWNEASRAPFNRAEPSISTKEFVDGYFAGLEIEGLKEFSPEELYDEVH